MQNMFGKLFYSLIPEPKVNFKFEIDSSCSVIACVDQGLAWANTSKALQLVDRDGSVKDTIQLDFDIKDLTVTSDGDILMTDFSNKCIKSVSRQKEIGNLQVSTLFRTRQLTTSILFSTSGKPSGLCCLQNGNILVTFPEDRKVVVYSSTGQIKKTLDHIKFSYPLKVAVNKLNQDLYIICDFVNHFYCELLTIRPDGQLRRRYSGFYDSF